MVHLSKWVHSPTFDGRRRRSWQVGKSDSSSCDRVKIATNHLLTKVDHQIPKLLATKYRISYFNDYISVVCFGLGHEQHTCCDIMFKHDLSLLIFYIYIYTPFALATSRTINSSSALNIGVLTPLELSSISVRLVHEGPPLQEIVDLHIKMVIYIDSP